MGYKTLELTLISAKDLKNVNFIGKMDPYVVVYLSDNPNTKQKTPIHQDGGTNPVWNYTIRFTVDEAAAYSAGKHLVLKIKHEQTLGSDEEFGEVLVSLKELFDGAKGKDFLQNLTYQVKRSSGKPNGELKFSCKFVDMGQTHTQSYDYGKTSTCSSISGHAAAAAAPVVDPPSGAGLVYPPPGPAPGYPAPVTASAQPYPPPSAAPYPPQGPPTAMPHAAPSTAEHGYPPYGAYPPSPDAAGYYPPPGGYPPFGGYPPAGYPQQVQQPQKPKKRNFGMGLGAGLIGGAIGGLLLDDICNAGCDAGLDGVFWIQTPTQSYDYGKTSTCSSSCVCAAAVAAPVGYPPSGAGAGSVYPPPGPAPGYPAPLTASAQPYPPPPSAAPYPPQGPPTAVSYAAPSAAAHGYPPCGAYPPPPHAAGYYPPPGGYPPSGGYPPAGYPQQLQQPQKSNFGMGLVAGLIRRAIGGLLVGEAVDDIYNAGYDAGFGDSGSDF